MKFSSSTTSNKGLFLDAISTSITRSHAQDDEGRILIQQKFLLSFQFANGQEKCDRLLDIQGASWHFQLSLHWIALQYQSRRHANWKKVHRSSRIHDTNELCRPNPDLHGEVILEIIILSNEHHVSSE
ncbi:hypothetical protein TYRP_020151 [Tyrophagus putrescentiae]|nr:hypothetical protein TYRP_020151 [Tyrophagus putrescentiae]